MGKNDTVEPAVHFDFDQFLREQAKEPVVMKVFGQIEVLPAELPAMILLRISDMQERGQSETKMSDVFDMAYGVFGEGRVKSWLQKGISVKGLETILMKAMEIYTGETMGDKKTPSTK